MSRASSDVFDEIIEYAKLARDESSAGLFSSAELHASTIDGLLNEALAMLRKERAYKESAMSKLDTAVSCELCKCTVKAGIVYRLEPEPGLEVYVCEVCKGLLDSDSEKIMVNAYNDLITTTLGLWPAAPQDSKTSKAASQ